MLQEKNTSSFVADVLSRLVGYGLPVVYFLVTVSFYLRTYDSAQIKITLTQIGCSLIILLWLSQLILERRWPYKKDDLLLMAPFLAYLASGVISYAQASFHEGSLDEFMRRVLYSFMGLVVLAEFRSWERHRRLLRWLMAAFGVVVFYGLVQFFDTRLFPAGPGQGIDPFVWRFAFGLRPFSSFGNPNFYGNFLVLITPIILAIYLRSGGQIFRPYLAIIPLVGLVIAMDKLFVGKFGGVDASSQVLMIIVLSVSAFLVLGLAFWNMPSAAGIGMLLFWGALFINLYATETKGAWMGFVAAFAATSILVGLFFTTKEQKPLVKVLFLAVLVMVLLGGSAVYYYAQKRKQSVGFRQFTWIATWEMIRTQPFFGAGIGTFKWAYPAFRRPEIIQIEGKSNTETDHSEDEYLEVWHDEGALGLGIFLWLILTVSVLGVKALSQLTRERAQGPPGQLHGERAFMLLAFLGAWWGGLIHWFVDVSVRFVSSGVYSVLLPAIVVSLVRYQEIPERQDPPAPYSWKIRLGFIFFWFVVFVSLTRPWRFTQPNEQFGSYFWILMNCVVIWALGEAFEWRLSSPAAASPAPPALPAEPAWKNGARWGAIGLLALIWFSAYRLYRGYFIADVNHNIAIFFSKQGVWSKSSDYDAQVAGFPPDMQMEYKEIGGALEHYELVMRLRPDFPMARYFIGNVYNDWGSTVFGQADAARQRGDMAQAQTLRDKAEAMWMKGLDTYDKVKAFAPNYVQTHHQVGLIYLKLGDMERVMGSPAKWQEYWDLALKNFALYRNLDPVFPPNYYRIAYIHFTRGDVPAAEKAYLDALTYSGERFPDRSAETYINLGKLLYYDLANRYPANAAADANDPAVSRAVKYFESAITMAQILGSDGDRWVFEGKKGLALIYSRANMRPQAERFWNEVRNMNPNDPDVQRVFQPQPGR